MKSLIEIEGGIGVSWAISCFLDADGQSRLAASMAELIHETLEAILAVAHENRIISMQHLPEKDACCFGLSAEIRRARL